MFPSRKNIGLKIVVKNLVISDYESKYQTNVAIRNTWNRNVGEEKFMSLEWDTSDSKKVGNLSKEIDVNFPILKEHRADDFIHFEFITRIQNSEGFPSPNISGQAELPLYDMTSAIKKGEKIFTVPIGCVQLQGIGNTQKGEMIVSIETPEIGKEINFSKDMPWYVLDKNKEYIEGVLNSYISKELKIYKNSKPIEDEINNVAHYITNDVVPIPGPYFFSSNATGRNPQKEEHFIYQLFKTSLKRNYKNNEWFETVANRIISQKPVTTEEKLDLVKVLADTCTVLTNNRYYSEDRAFSSNNGLINVEDFRIQERFANVDPKFASGDCEDGARTIADIGYRIQTGDFTRSDLNCLKKIANLYTFCGTLSSVQGAQIKDTKGSVKQIRIGSKEDKTVKKGAHMFVIGVSKSKFLSMVKSSNSSQTSLSEMIGDGYSYSKTEVYSSADLPTLVLEGTGSLSPFVFPLQYYAKNEKEFSQLRERVLREQHGLDVLNQKETMAISAGVLQRIPPWVEDTPDSFPDFYRYLIQVYVNNPSKPMSFVFSNGKIRGASIRSLCLLDLKRIDLEKERHYTPPILQKVPSSTPAEIKVYESLRRQLPFPPPQEIHSTISASISKGKSDSGVEREKALLDFRNKYKNFRSSNSDFVRMTVSYRHDTIFDIGKDNKNLLTLISEELDSNANILSADPSMRFFTDTNYAVDISYKIKCSDQDVQIISGRLTDVYREFTKDTEDRFITKVFKAISDRETRLSSLGVTTTSHAFKILISMKHNKSIVGEFLKKKGEKMLIVPSISSENDTEWVNHIKVSNPSVHEWYIKNHLLYKPATKKKTNSMIWNTMNDSPAGAIQIVGEGSQKQVVFKYEGSPNLEGVANLTERVEKEMGTISLESNPDFKELEKEFKLKVMVSNGFISGFQ